jgi:hypothetical protein
LTVAVALADSDRVVQVDGRPWATNNAAGGATFCFALPVMARS